MTQKTCLVLLFFSVLKLVVSQYGCSDNEYLTETVNPCNACEIRGWCPQTFEPWCDCLPGFFRNNMGICVPPEACDEPFDVGIRQAHRCKQFEQYRECGSACPPTCQNRHPVCTAVCVRGCFCTHGRIKNRRGVCVRPNQCSRGRASDPNECGPNEEFRPCGSACPPTCEKMSGVPCTQQCVTGCFCVSGYVRKDGICVRESECGNNPISPRRGHFDPAFYGRPVGAYPPAVPAAPPPSYIRPPPPPPSYLRPPPPPPPPSYLRPPPPPPPPSYLRPPPPPPPPPPSHMTPPPPSHPSPPPPPTDNKGCPNRNKCNRSCRLSGFSVGFCVNEGFLKCNCLG